MSDNPHESQMLLQVKVNEKAKLKFCILATTVDGFF
jgi:hypothetical protein